MTVAGIRDYIINYLNFMVLLNSSSLETIRAYRSDLRQAFHLKQLELPSVEEFFHALIRVMEVAKLLGQEQEILTACRLAMKNWSNLAPATRNRKAATLKSFLGWLHKEGLIGRDLAAQVHSPKVPVRLPHFLSVDEIQALLAALQADLTGERLQKHEIMEAEKTWLLVLLLYGGGLRISEACSLEWSSISGDARVLRITGKGKKERIAALPPLVAAAILRYRKLLSTHDTPFVFGETPLHTRIGYEMVRRAGQRAGLLKPLHPHALRHSFATHLLTSGANLRSLQELLGHESLQATSRYTHLGIDQLARTLEDFHPLGPKILKS
jgi:integrase/recombinase XerC/integrase/recombinase XerD